MSFSQPSTNFIPASQQQSQQQSINAYNELHYPNMMNSYPGIQTYYTNNYQYVSTNFGQTYNNMAYFPSPPKIPESASKQSKRESTPLLVFDPHKKEVINLAGFSKSGKTSSLIDEIKSAPLISVPVRSSDLLNQSQLEFISKNEDFHENSLDQSVQNYLEKENGTDESCFDDEIVSIKFNIQDQGDLIPFLSANQTIKVSKSIPNKLGTLSSSSVNISKSEISSSEDNLFQKLSYSIIELSNEANKSRLMYDRDTMIRLSKSPFCRKPNISCQDIIEPQAVKNYNLASRLKNSNENLIRTVNGYLPPHLRINVECSLNQDLDNSRRLFKCILNKIAPQNFDLCVSEIKNLITSTDLQDVKMNDFINCLIEEIFDKAVQQESYSVTYADLCTQIVKYDDTFAMKWSFKKSLIERCKTMFETPLQEQLASVRTYWEKRIEVETDEKMKHLFMSDVEEQVKKAKDKYFGNIRFIGELYLHELLKASIINQCVKTLMAKANEEDAMFSLCKLLETCGKKFDKIHKDKMKEYISSMTEIADAEERNTRVKYRLYDIIEMSERNWALRQIQAQKIIQPTTLDKVKKDDVDEKINEASKVSNRSVSIKKKQNNNAGDLKFKLNQNKNQSMDINSLQISSNECFALKPTYGVWSSGSGSKEVDPEWQSVEKRNSRFNKNNKKTSLKIKSSPVASREDSPLKNDVGGRFALLQQHDIDSSIAVTSKLSYLSLRERTPECEKERCNDTTSTSSTREHSPSYWKSDENVILDADGIYQKLIDSGSFDVTSWCQISDVYKTVANWLDKMMEKNKMTRNMLGDELSNLVVSGKLSIIDLTDGIKEFLKEIDDLKTDIPLIWNFLAEFIERFTVNSESDISFYKTIFEFQKSKKDVANCISLCIKYAVDRLGQNIMLDVWKKCSWSFKDFVAQGAVDEFLRSTDLIFLLEEPVNFISFISYEKDLIFLLPNDVEEINEFLDDAFGLKILQTEECVYFISCCVFSHISSLLLDDATAFLIKKKLFFLRILDRRSEFERQTLRALNDAAPILEQKGLLAAVIYGLGDNIISYDAFEQFIQRDKSSAGITESSDCALTTDVIRAMLQNRCR